MSKPRSEPGPRSRSGSEHPVGSEVLAVFEPVGCACACELRFESAPRCDLEPRRDPAPRTGSGPDSRSRSSILPVEPTSFLGMSAVRMAPKRDATLRE